MDIYLPSVLLAIDIGGTHIRLAGFQADSEMCWPIISFPTQELTAENYRHMFLEAIRGYHLAQQISLQGIVIGIPGVLSADLSYPVFVANVQMIAHPDFASFLADQFDCPVLLERDSNLLLLGEWRNGCAQDTESALGVFMGTGVGASFMLAGNVARGYTSTALELGHIPIRDTGVRCICGKMDCLEAYASGRVLAQIAEQATIPISQIFTEGLSRPNLQSRLNQFIEDNARAVAIAVQLFDPAQVVLGGGVPHMAGFPQDEFSQMVRQHLLSPVSTQQVVISWTQLGEQAFIYGAQAVWEMRQQNSPHRLF